VKPSLVPGALGEPPGTQVIDSRYRLAKELARGGMGRVFLAVDTELRRNVAIKIIASATADANARARFRREALTLAQLSHPNVLTVYDTGPKEREGDPYLVCELLEGTTLREKAASALPLSEVLDIAAQTASGLAAAHAVDIVHRDLKPDNIFITRDGRVKLIDFGIAKVLLPPQTLAEGDPIPDNVAPATAEGKIIGTMGYMAPEQIRGGSVDRRADIFSFGAVLYELVAGRRAFQGPTPYATGLAILNEAAPSLPRRVPAEVRRIVERCLEKDPARRFASARELLAHIERARATAGRRPWGPWLVGSALVVTAAAMLVLWPKAAPGAGGPLTLQIAPVRSAAADAPVAGAVAMALERAFGAIADVVRIGPGGEWVLKTELSMTGSQLRVVAHFESADGQRVGDAVEAVSRGSELDATELSARVREVFMRLWRDRSRRAHAHALAHVRGAEEKLLAYYDLMGPSARPEFLDRGRALLDSALAADPRYVPALAERSTLLRLAAERPGDDPATDLRLARADADEAMRLAPRDPQALLAECQTARRQMHDWPSDRELSAATSACSDATQADPHSAVALYMLAFLHDQACDYGALIATLKLAIDRAARYDRSLLAPLRFYLVSVALQRRHLEEADAFSSDLVAQVARDEQVARSAPLQGAHLLRAAVLMRLDRNAEAEREIEAELAHGASAIGGLDEIVEVAALRGLSRLQHGAIGPARAARLSALEKRFAAEDERSNEPSRVAGWFGFMDPEGAVAWMDAHKTQGGCEMALHRARIYRDAGHADRAERALEACKGAESWAQRCARVISSDLASFAPPVLR
jgi:hypothetical protein